ncbi:TPA: ATP-grasp domain-containing protein [Candidatus Saccharibacteria bacterium]|nr:ATP-grasp domain-containing protein [Candidatus Saccharibacteria bacterium]HIO87962.1 ATP-grasp domain-containing protein [Candidatus Saccharibacteria bacterium]
MEKQFSRDTVIVLATDSKDVGDSLSIAIDKLEKKLRRPLQRVWLIDKSQKANKSVFQKDFTKIEINLKSPKQIHEALLPYLHRVIAITCRSEDLLENFKRVIPHVPYTLTPTETSINWSTDKLLMRRRFTEYDKKITPAYTIATDISDKTISKIKRKVGFPLVIKPSGLAASVLVSICYHEEELVSNLKRTLRQVKAAHKSYAGRGEPKVLIEQFLEGTMYSIDGYVDNTGRVDFVPPVHIKTGRAIGFDDFFGYKQMTPVKLLARKIKDMEQVAAKGVHALGLRNTIVHVEVIKTELTGFKIVEIACRMGGFRQNLYQLSYGFDHAYNDLLVRTGRKPIIKKKRQGYTASMKFFSNKEGRLEKINGMNKARALTSFYNLKINKTKGDMCKFAKNGGKSVFNITLHNKSRSDLLADIRRLEQAVKIEVTPVKTKKA